VAGPSRQPNLLETKGLILVALLVLIFLVVRYWNQIPWSAR
jgi:hypothetical protein